MKFEIKLSACQATVLSVVDYSTVGKLDIAREKNVADDTDN